MSFTKLQDGRGTYALDSLRLRSLNEIETAPQENTFELYIKNGDLYQMNSEGVERLLSGPTNINLSNLAAEVVALLIPVGSLVAYGGTLAPTGWLLCQGQSLNQADYASLYSTLGQAFGNGSTGAIVGTAGGSRFNLPDFRGRFLRGLDENAGNDPDKASRTAMAPGGNTGNNVGSIQADEFKTHQHLFGGDDQIGPSGGYTGVGDGFSYDATSTTSWPSTSRHYRTKSDSTNFGSTETRPKNAYVNYIIKT